MWSTPERAVGVGLTDFDRGGCVPMRRISVFSLFRLRKLNENQVFISSSQMKRELGATVEVGLEER